MADPRRGIQPAVAACYSASSMKLPTVEEIFRSVLTSRVYEIARETSLDAAPRLSSRLNNTVLLKREDQQPVFSFKLRGAYNRIVRLTESERQRGVITA